MWAKRNYKKTSKGIVEVKNIVIEIHIFDGLINRMDSWERMSEVEDRSRGAA